MKKLFAVVACLALISSPCFAQDYNKPEANSFGMQYGVNFNGTVGQAVELSGWLKHGIEVRGSIAFSYINNESSTVNFSYTYTPDNRQLPTTTTNSSSSASMTVTPVVSVVKHFPLQSKLDFFLGGAASFGFTVPTSATKTSSSTQADSFYSYTSNSLKSPLAFNWGLSIVGGANYFFYKNLAIGADFGLGFTASNGNGTSRSQQIEINNGANNNNTVNYNRNFSSKVTNTRYAANIAGNAGLHLTYYLKVKDHRKANDVKM